MATSNPPKSTAVRASPGDNVKPEGGVPLGHGTADEPANTLPAEPAQITQLPTHQADAAPSKGSKSGGKPQAAGKALDEEPELKNEEDIPSDGRDAKGEAMIDKLGDSTSVKFANAKAEGAREGKAS